MCNPCPRCLPRLTLLLGGFLSFCCMASEAEADKNRFVVETQVNLPGHEKAPLVRTTTLYVEGMAYDIVHGNPAEIARFDFGNQLVDLASRARRMRTQLPFDELRRFEAALRARAQARAGLGAFLASPNFAQEYDAQQKTLWLTSPWLSYEAQVTDADAEVLEQITLFADWSARLNSMLNPTASPMPARLELNRALRQQNWRAVRITRRGEARAQTLGAIQSRHRLRPWRESDTELIVEIQNDLKNFPAVSFSEFRAVQLSARDGTKK